MKLVVFFLSIILSSATAVSAKSELKIGMTQEFDNLNPIMTNMLASRYLLSMVTRSFMITGPRGELQPQVVDQVPTFENGRAKFITENGKRKVRSVWKIKKNVKWGDGTPLTCEDFIFTLKVAKNAKAPVPNLGEFEKIEKVGFEKGNKKHCVFTHSDANWAFNQIGILAILPKHLEEAPYKKYGQKKNGYTHQSLYTKKPTTPGLYAGPYLVSEIKQGSHIVLTVNPHFYGSKPKIPKVILKLIPNTGTLEANLLSGTIDMISSFGMTFDQALKFHKKVVAKNLPYRVFFQPSFVYEHIDVNLENEILSDLGVRKALRHATNAAAMSKALFDGKQPAALHFISPADPWYSEDEKYVKKYPYSLRKAKKLLEKSGWKMSSDGYRYKNGKKLEISIMSTSGRKIRELVEVYLKGEWKKIGVDLIIRNVPARVFFGEYTRQAKFPHLAMYSFVGAPESTSKASYHSAFIPRPENNFSGVNRTKWKNKKVDSLFEQLDEEFNFQKRQDLMKQVLKHYTHDVPAIPLFYRSDISITPKGMKGYKMTGTLYTEANHVEDWEL